MATASRAAVDSTTASYPGGYEFGFRPPAESPRSDFTLFSPLYPGESRDNNLKQTHRVTASFDILPS
jgi:hypothetical protein